MPRSLTTRCLRGALLGAALLLGANAYATYVRAQAEEGGSTPVIDQNPGAVATAASPNAAPGGDASASATRLTVSAASNGAGAGPLGHQYHAASASNYTTYRLWDFDLNAAMDPAEARLLNLSFNFRLLSWLDVPVGTVGLDVGTASYEARVVSLDSATIHTRADSVSYAVGPPDSHTGNLSMLGGYDLSFALMHDASDDGWLEMSYGNSSANDVQARGALMLMSISVSEDVVLASLAGLQAQAVPHSVQQGRRLGVMFDNGAGHLFNTPLQPASGVPVPGTLWLALGTLAWVLRRASAA
jgi:hypothetical protein